MLSQYELGKAFPLTNPQGKASGVYANIHGESFDVICWGSGLNSKGIQEWKRGTLRYGVLSGTSRIPFFLLYFPLLRWPFDISINVLALKEQGIPIQEYLDGSGNLVNLFLVDVRTNMLKAIRPISLERLVADSLRAACNDQLEHYATAKEVGDRIQGILSSTSTGAMIRATSMVEVPSR